MTGTVNSTEIFLDILVTIPKIYCLALVLFIVTRLYQNMLTTGDFKQFKSWFSRIDTVYLVISFLVIGTEQAAENFLNWLVMLLLLIFVRTLDTNVLRIYHRLPIVIILFVLELGALLAHFEMPSLLTGLLWFIEAGIIVFAMVGYFLLVIRLHHDKGKSGDQS